MFSLYTLKTPLEFKNKLMNYRNLIQNIIDKKPLDRKKLEDSYLFFTKIAKKGDLEAAKNFYSQSDED